MIRIDLADSKGNLDLITPWLIQRLKSELENGLFRGNTPSFEELQGVFYGEYQRWKRGEHKYLYEDNKTQFKIKFGEHISNLISNHTDKYINYLLEHSVRSRSLMPCIIFDNTDHFSQSFQETVYQFAQSIHRSVFSFIICPVTDRTIWQLSKSGPFQSYISSTFYLPVPSTKEILSKRVNFIMYKLEEDKAEKGEYFLSKGIRLSIRDIKAFAACVESILINVDYVSKIIGWISNYDIRRSLRISQRIVTSPIISIEDIVKTYLLGKMLFIPPYQIKKALICGDYNHFSQSDSEFVVNMFSIRPERPTSPLVKLSILQFLSDMEIQFKESDDAYVNLEDIQNYFEPTGLSRSIVNNYIQELLEFRLVEPYDPTNQEIFEEQRIKITHSGKIHIDFCLSEDTYISHMAFVTPIESYEIVSDIRDKMELKLRREDWLNIVSVFILYCLKQDRIYISIPNITTYDGQLLLRQRLKGKWTIEGSISD